MNVQAVKQDVAANGSRVASVVEALRRVTEFYFQLATVLVLAGLIHAAAEAHPKSKELDFANSVTVWAVLAWTALHISPLIYRFMRTSSRTALEHGFAWGVSILGAVVVAIYLIHPFAVLASGWVR